MPGLEKRSRRPFAQARTHTLTELASMEELERLECADRAAQRRLGPVMLTGLIGKPPVAHKRAQSHMTTSSATMEELEELACSGRATPRRLEPVAQTGLIGKPPAVHKQARLHPWTSRAAMEELEVANGMSPTALASMEGLVCSDRAAQRRLGPVTRTGPIGKPPVSHMCKG